MTVGHSDPPRRDYESWSDYQTSIDEIPQLDLTDTPMSHDSQCRESRGKRPMGIPLPVQQLSGLAHLAPECVTRKHVVVIRVGRQMNVSVDQAWEDGASSRVEARGPQRYDAFSGWTCVDHNPGPNVDQPLLMMLVRP
jgi:hypothetical protein